MFAALNLYKQKYEQLIHHYTRNFTIPQILQV